MTTCPPVEHSGIAHVAEYLTAAGEVVVGAEKSLLWGMEHKRRMLAREFALVLSKLTEHVCD